jgi:hypothetical protein
MPIKLTQTEFIKRAEQVHHNHYNYSLTVYKTAHTQIEIVCNKHGSFFQLPSNHLKGCGCPKCGFEAIASSKQLDAIDFLAKATKAHKGKYDYSHVVYLGYNSKIEVICPTHGTFWQRANNHLAGIGCKKCGIESSRQAQLKLYTIPQNSKLQPTSSDPLVDNQREFICSCGRVTTASAYNVQVGKVKTCGNCSARPKSYWISQKWGYLSLDKTQTLPDEWSEFSHQPLLFLCAKCGRKSYISINQVVQGHSKTCGKCFYNKKDYWLMQKWGYWRLDQTQPLPEEWANQSHQVFWFICGNCNQRFQHTMYGITGGMSLSCGCASNAYSKPHQEVNEYLHSIGIGIKDIAINDRYTIHPYELDSLISSHNLAIEFNGTYYHSLDGSESSLAKYRHRDKFNLCQQKGITLLQIDEHEWNNPITQEVWKSVIASKLGKHIRIPARKTAFKPISNIEAEGFLAFNHLQGSTSVLSWSFGLFYNDELVGVISYCYHQHTQINLTRLAFKLNTTVIGGANKLFKNSLPFLPPGDIVSFSSNRYSNGSIYPTLGFTKDKDLPPSYQWYFKGRIWNKRSLRRKSLQIILGSSFDSNETEHQNLYRNKARCLYDAGYQRWLYTTHPVK